MYTVAPNIAMPARKLMTSVTRITLLRNRRSGSTGSSARPSCHMKTTSRMTLATINEMISIEFHGYELPPQTVTSSKPATAP